MGATFRSSLLLPTVDIRAATLALILVELRVVFVTVGTSRGLGVRRRTAGRGAVAFLFPSPFDAVASAAEAGAGALGSVPANGNQCLTGANVRRWTGLGPCSRMAWT